MARFHPLRTAILDSEKVDGIREWMRTEQISAMVATDVVEFMNQKYKDRKVFDQHQLIEDLKPSPIAEELMQEVYSEMIAQVPFIKGLMARQVRGGSQIVARSASPISHPNGCLVQVHVCALAQDCVLPWMIACGEQYVYFCDPCER
eukprot:SAG31_NODE_1918_length_6921_cov_2.015245_5_plen_147_part_00